MVMLLACKHQQVQRIHSRPEPVQRWALSQPHARTRPRPALKPRAGAGNIGYGSGGEEDAGGFGEQGFEVDTAGTVCKLMTAKATQHVLQQLSETDLVVCQWLNNFAADNPPLGGDDFILKMMSQRPESIRDTNSGCVHHINPQELGSRIISMRAELAVNVSALVPGQIKQKNIDLLRKHLESVSYTSGSSSPGGSGPPLRRRGSSRPGSSAIRRRSSRPRWPPSKGS